MNNEIEYTVRAAVQHAMLLRVRASVSRVGDHVNMTVELDGHKERKRKSIKQLLNDGCDEQEACQRVIEEFVHSVLNVDHDAFGDMFLELAGDACWSGGELYIEVLPYDLDIYAYDCHRDKMQPYRVLAWQEGRWSRKFHYMQYANALREACWSVDVGLTDHARVECYWHEGEPCSRGIRAVIKRRGSEIWQSVSTVGVMSEDDLTVWERIG